MKLSWLCEKMSATKRGGVSDHELKVEREAENLKPGKVRREHRSANLVHCDVADLIPVVDDVLSAPGPIDDHRVVSARK